eukprot:1547215-Alexandrium_andersonii.AAC.1
MAPPGNPDTETVAEQSTPNIPGYLRVQQAKENVGPGVTWDRALIVCEDPGITGSCEPVGAMCRCHERGGRW